MAEQLQQVLGVKAELIPGAGGVFEVSVNGAVIAKKNHEGFPSDDAVLAAVRQALQ